PPAPDADAPPRPERAAPPAPGEPPRTGGRTDRVGRDGGALDGSPAGPLRGGAGAHRSRVRPRPQLRCAAGGVVSSEPRGRLRPSGEPRTGGRTGPGGPRRRSALRAGRGVEWDGTAGSRTGRRRVPCAAAPAPTGAGRGLDCTRSVRRAVPRLRTAGASGAAWGLRMNRRASEAARDRAGPRRTNALRARRHETRSRVGRDGGTLDGASAGPLRGGAGARRRRAGESAPSRRPRLPIRSSPGDGLRGRPAAAQGRQARPRSRAAYPRPRRGLRRPCRWAGPGEEGTGTRTRPGNGEGPRAPAAPVGRCDDRVGPGAAG